MNDNPNETFFGPKGQGLDEAPEPQYYQIGESQFEAPKTQQDERIIDLTSVIQTRAQKYVPIDVRIGERVITFDSPLARFDLYELIDTLMSGADEEGLSLSKTPIALELMVRCAQGNNEPFLKELCKENPMGAMEIVKVLLADLGDDDEEGEALED